MLEQVWCFCFVVFVCSFIIYRGIKLFIGGNSSRRTNVIELETFADGDREFVFPLSDTALDIDSNTSKNLQHVSTNTSTCSLDISKASLVVQFVLCTCLVLLSSARTYFSDSNSFFIIIQLFTWLLSCIICVASNITLVLPKTCTLHSSTDAIHTGEKKQVQKEVNISKIQSYKTSKRRSSKILHFVFLLFLLGNISLLTTGWSIEFINEILEGFTGSVSVETYFLFSESLISGILFISFLASAFSFSKITYGFSQDKSTIEFLNEIENLAKNANLTSESSTTNEKLSASDDEDKDDTGDSSDKDIDIKHGFFFNVLRLTKEMIPEFGLILPAMVFVIVEAICAVLVSLLIGYCISIFTPNVDGSFGIGSLGSTMQEAEGDENSEEFKTSQFIILLRISGVLLSVMAIQCISSGMSNTLCEQASERMAARLRSKTFLSLLDQELGHFDEVMSGDIWSRLTNDTNEMKKAVNAASMAIYCSLVSLSGVFILLVISWKLTLSMLCVVPFLGIGILFQSTLISKYTTLKMDALSKAGSAAEEILANIKIVKSSGTENKEAKRYGFRVFEAFRIARKTSVVEGLANAGIFFMFNIGCVVALVAAGYLVLTEQLSTGAVVIYLMFIIDLMAYLSMLPDYLSEFSKAVGASNTLFNIIDRTPKLKDIGTEPFVEGAIEFRNVSFTYPTRKENQILDNVSVHIPSNSTIGLLGPSGSGKSTILSLLMHFYEPNAGDILVGGKPLSCFNLDSLRSNIALVLQDSMLFTDTVANNISYGFNSPDMARVIEAAKAANAHDFIMDLPQKYDTIISKSTLSGGQRQRVSIARALFKNPRIVLLDEYTSGLDLENQASVIESVTCLTEDKTVIIISHSEHSVQHADKIMVLNDGTLTERQIPIRNASAPILLPQN